MKKTLLLLLIIPFLGCVNSPSDKSEISTNLDNIVTDNMIDSRYTGKGTHISTRGLFKGNKYVGEWKDGKFHGSGSYIFYNQDGDTYVGEFRDGKQNGKGIYTWVSGGKYSGDFKDNKMHGYGTFIRNNIGTYVGEFKEGVFHGQGTYTLVNGEIVNGPWNNGVPIK